MSTQPQMVGTAVVVIAGRWANGKSVDIRTGIGLGVYALGIAAIAAADPKLASQFATLVLVSAGFIYIVPISQKLGLLDRHK